MGQGYVSGLAGQLWLKVCDEIAGKLSTRATVVPGLRWGCRMLFQVHSHGFSGFSSFACHITGDSWKPKENFRKERRVRQESSETVAFGKGYLRSGSCKVTSQTRVCQQVLCQATWGPYEKYTNSIHILSVNNTVLYIWKLLRHYILKVLVTRKKL